MYHLDVCMQFLGVAGYRTSLTHWWSPVRAWAKSLSFFTQNPFFFLHLRGYIHDTYEQFTNTHSPVTYIQQNFGRNSHLLLTYYIILVAVSGDVLRFSAW